jgi:hypothetical protein
MLSISHRQPDVPIRRYHHANCHSAINIHSDTFRHPAALSASPKSKKAATLLLENTSNDIVTAFVQQLVIDHPFLVQPTLTKRPEQSCLCFIVNALILGAPHQLRATYIRLSCKGPGRFALSKKLFSIALL